MSVNEINLPFAGERAAVNHKWLGIIGMICAPGLYFASFFYSQNYDQPNPQQIYASLLGVLYLCGAAASATAMRQLRVTGNGRGAAILYAVQITGLILAMMFDVIEYAAPDLKQSWFFFVTDMAYPFSHVLMLIVAVAVIRAGVWRGWRRIPAFIVGLTLPSFFIMSAIVGRENGGFIFPVLVTLGFFLLGYAVITTKPQKA